MAGDAKKEDGKRPIIIKKIKKGGHGHHGGAWKVAYADFVTAMMAFFLLLWLLSTTSKSRLEGLAEYFTPTTGIKDAAGIGFKGGLTDTVNGTSKGNMSNPGIVLGHTPTGTVPENNDNQAKAEGEQDANLFKQGATAIEQTFSQDLALQKYKDNIHVQQTPDGLKIDIVDTDKYGMFEPGTPKLTGHGEAILTRMAILIKKLPNFISITGHTDASPLESGRAEYTNWELSSDRAQAARRYLLLAGMEAERPKKIIGMADRELYNPEEPRGPTNRRVTIIMLRGSHILIPDAAVPKSEPAAEPSQATPLAPVPAGAKP